MQRLQNRLIRDGMQAVLGASAWLAQHPTLYPLTRPAMATIGRLTVAAKAIRTADTPEGLAKQWQRSFPSPKQVPIVSADTNTAIAEIHTPCPLRGSGDTAACYRMMQFDRTVVGQAGGRFVVLDSQAEPGRDHCRIAIRNMGADISDLTAAHEKAIIG